MKTKADTGCTLAVLGSGALLETQEEQTRMPHIIVKLWPGKTKAQKIKLGERITEAVMDELGYGEESVSVAFEEIDSSDWKDAVYGPDIVEKSDTLVKKPGYSM